MGLGFVGLGFGWEANCRRRDVVRGRSGPVACVAVRSFGVRVSEDGGNEDEEATYCYVACSPLRNDYLERVLTAKVYDVAVESALEEAPLISGRINNRVLLKREDTQPVFSFKLRGAYNMMANAPSHVLENGVVAASAGNHAQVSATFPP